jgi:hypothetical protein
LVLVFWWSDDCSICLFCSVLFCLVYKSSLFRRMAACALYCVLLCALKSILSCNAPPSLVADPNKSPPHARSTAASTWAPSEAPRRSWRRTRSRRWRCWSTRSWAWRRCGGSRWRTSRPSSWWTTRATTSTLSGYHRSNCIDTVTAGYRCTYCLLCAWCVGKIELIIIVTTTSCNCNINKQHD